MTTSDYFLKDLKVQFTMSELYQISSALATESFSESDAGRYNNSNEAWQLRAKVRSFIDLYKKS